MKVLAISGSLRLGASNTSLLEAAARVAPEGIVVHRYPTIAVLPHFNPDDDTFDYNAVPKVVAEFRTLIGDADALLLSTPEYAHGLPGSFKNALDWLVGSIEFPGKPVAMISPSARSTYAQAQLREILKTMSARIVESASVVIPLPRREMMVDEIVADETVTGALRSVLTALAADVNPSRQLS
jgi:NAD(P)H-dependent FMN reductase